jgi:hypothetical protein
MRTSSGHSRAITDYQLAATYWSQLIARTQPGGESLKKTAMPVEQLANWVLIELLEDFLQRAAAHAFIIGMKD